MVIATFRTNFPEFTDVTAYPDATITFWSNLAEKQVRECVWKDVWSEGVQLYTAHCIAIAKNNTNAAAVGGVPGATSGPANSKTVGSASVSYDTVVASEKNAGWWNTTSYGRQFYALARMYGAGSVQL